MNRTALAMVLPLSLLGCPNPKTPQPKVGPSGFQTITLTTKKRGKKSETGTGQYLRYSFQKGKQVPAWKVTTADYHTGRRTWENEVELGIGFGSDLVASYGRLYGPRGKTICDLGPMTLAQFAAVTPNQAISRAWTQDVPLVAGNAYVMARGREFGNGYALIRVVSIPSVKWADLQTGDQSSVTLEWKVVPGS